MAVVSIVVRRYPVIVLLLSGSGSLGLSLSLSVLVRSRMGMLLLLMALGLMKPGRLSLGVLVLMRENMLRGKHL